jgi:hypothetical protein
VPLPRILVFQLEKLYPVFEKPFEATVKGEHPVVDAVDPPVALLPSYVIVYCGLTVPLQDTVLDVAPVDDKVIVCEE